MKLLSMGYTNPKLKKSDAAGLGYMSAIQYLKPFTSSGLINLCPMASAGCAAACLNTAGRGRTNSVQEARQRRTEMYVRNSDSYKIQLTSEVERFVKKCKKNGQKPAIRLNGTSDIMWEKVFPALIETYRDVQWYDYTKITRRMLKFCASLLPSNYHLTFSRSEDNDEDCVRVLRAGGNVAVVFKKELPRIWKRFKVHNGDTTDLRFLDEKGVIGLYAKGKAKTDESGFVV